MKKIIPVLSIFGLIVFLHACNKNNIEVATQDTSYQLDAEYFKIEFPDSFKFNPNNIIYLPGIANVTLEAKTNEKGTFLENNLTSIPIKIRVKRALTKAVKVKLVRDQALLDNYNGDTADFSKLPNDTYTITEGTLDAGKLETNLTLTFKNMNSLTAIPGYILPLKLEVIGDAEDVDVSTTASMLFLKIKVAFSNIDNSNKEAPQAFINRESPKWTVDVSSIYSNFYGNNMLDGDRRTAWFSYYAFTGYETATLDMQKENNVKGIQVFPNFVYPTNNSTKIEVLTSNDKVTWITQGAYIYSGPAVDNDSFSNPEIIRNIHFYAPVNARYIRLKMFSSNYTGIGELNVF